jgi:hypothetical protein
MHIDTFQQVLLHVLVARHRNVVLCMWVVEHTVALLNIEPLGSTFGGEKYLEIAERSWYFPPK